jgi:acetolactate synthase-1/2/3 large subunit
MNGADLLCETLLAHDIDICFANPGTSEMHFVAALDRQPRMRCVLGLFEGVVTGAADGYARMAGKPAVTLLHLGPGAANGLANMHNARKARTGMINVIGDHARRHLAHDAPLTSDIDTLLRPMSNWNRRIATPDTLGEDVAAAIRAACQPPGQIANLIRRRSLSSTPHHRRNASRTSGSRT